MGQKHPPINFHLLYIIGRNRSADLNDLYTGHHENASHFLGKSYVLCAFALKKYLAPAPGSCHMGVPPASTAPIPKGEVSL
jgi:hypothetical protein